MPKKTKNPTETRHSIPMPVRVQEDEEFRPLVVTFEGQTLAVESIDERVEEEAEWWEPEPLFKMHYRVTLENGRGGDLQGYEDGELVQGGRSFGLTPRTLAMTTSSKSETLRYPLSILVTPERSTCMPSA